MNKSLPQSIPNSPTSARTAPAPNPSPRPVSAYKTRLARFGRRTAKTPYCQKPKPGTPTHSPQTRRTKTTHAGTPPPHPPEQTHETPPPHGAEPPEPDPAEHAPPQPPTRTKPPPPHRQPKPKPQPRNAHGTTPQGRRPATDRPTAGRRSTERQRTGGRGGAGGRGPTTRGMPGAFIGGGVGADVRTGQASGTGPGTRGAGHQLPLAGGCRRTEGAGRTRASAGAAATRHSAAGQSGAPRPRDSAVRERASGSTPGCRFTSPHHVLITSPLTLLPHTITHTQTRVCVARQSRSHCAIL